MNGQQGNAKSGAREYGRKNRKNERKGLRANLKLAVAAESAAYKAHQKVRTIENWRAYVDARDETNKAREAEETSPMR